MRFMGPGKLHHLEGTHAGWSACGVQSKLLCAKTPKVNCLRCVKTRLFKAKAAERKTGMHPAFAHPYGIRPSPDELTLRLTDK